ncbi:MAG: glucuronate isomerase, partial [Clostridia bacterium]|nr:glucuronate isomerase [Clostridia bacterium]
MGRDFLLYNEPAVEMFEAAEKMPVFDWHCHLSPKEIYENKEPADIAELAVFSRWGDGGRDGVVVESVYVKCDG